MLLCYKLIFQTSHKGQNMSTVVAILIFTIVACDMSILADCVAQNPFLVSCCHSRDKGP